MWENFVLENVAEKINKEYSSWEIGEFCGLLFLCLFWTKVCTSY